MDFSKNLKASYEYIKTLVIWVFISALVGTVGGVVGSIFHESIDYGIHIRMEYPAVILLLPLGGLLITAMYRLFKNQGAIDTNRVIESVAHEEKVPLVMAPLIFLSTVITQFLGGSAGREGAALQLGGSIGYNTGRLFKFKKNDMHIIVSCGMSAVFAALFGTPLTAAFFAIEVISVGIFHYAALVPCLISVYTAYGISIIFGIKAVRFSVLGVTLSFSVIAKALIFSVLCALVSILFCTSIKKTSHFAKAYIKNPYLRTIIGSLVIIILTFSLETQDYNGAGMDVIIKIMNGNLLHPEAFILKIIFTSVTIAAGFKGGEIVPAFFVGSSFGYIAGGMLGLDPVLGAALGFVALFCGSVNCPIASIFLALELFGHENIMLFALVCAVSYMMSGCFGLYRSQTIVYSKLSEEQIDVHTH